jgi:hypothetical protein
LSDGGHAIHIVIAVNTDLVSAANRLRDNSSSVLEIFHSRRIRERLKVRSHDSLEIRSRVIASPSKYRRDDLRGAISSHPNFTA